MKKIKKLLTFSVSIIILFNLSTCSKKETDLPELNPNIINPQRMQLTTNEITTPINEFLWDMQDIDIPLNGSEYSRNLQEKLKKSTYSDGVYTLTNSYGFNYIVSNSYLVITSKDKIELMYNIFDNRKEIVAYDSVYGKKSSYVEYSTHIEYAVSESDLTGERFYQIELYDDGGYAISWTHFMEYTQFGSMRPIKEIFDKDGYLKEVEFDAGTKATRLFGEYTMVNGELFDSQGNIVMEGVSYRALQYDLRGISLANGPWMIIINEED